MSRQKWELHESLRRLKEGGPRFVMFTLGRLELRPLVEAFKQSGSAA